MTADEIRWELFEQAVRGFFFEKHLPGDTADEWTDEIIAIVQENGLTPKGNETAPERPQRVFLCRQHDFVTVVRGGEIDCHGSPGHRAAGCGECDAVVADAFAAAGVEL